MRHFNSRWFFVLTVLLAVVAYLSFNSAYARDEGSLGKDFIHNFFADAFNVMRFPTHVLLPVLTRTPVYFVLGLITNCLLYSLALERIIYLIFNRNADNEEDNPARQ